MDPETKIVIVGAGIVGSVIAFQLTRRHRNVTVVDASRPGSGATFALGYRVDYSDHYMLRR